MPLFYINQNMTVIRKQKVALTPKTIEFTALIAIRVLVGASPDMIVAFEVL